MNLSAAAAPIITCASTCRRLERELDPRSPRFEDAGLGSKCGGEVQLKGDRLDGGIADAAAKYGIGFEAG